MHVFMIWDNCITCIALVYNLVHGDVLSSNACSTTPGLRLGILLVACLPESSPSECHTTKCINIEINQNGQNPAPVHVLSLLIMKPLSIPKFHAGFSPSTKRSNVDAENVKWPSLHTTSQSPHLFRKLSQFGKGSDLLPKSTLVKIITKKQMFHAARRSSSWVQFKLQESLKILVLMAKRPWYTLYTPTKSWTVQLSSKFVLFVASHESTAPRYAGLPSKGQTQSALEAASNHEALGFLHIGLDRGTKRITKKMLIGD